VLGTEILMPPNPSLPKGCLCRKFIPSDLCSLCYVLNHSISQVMSLCSNLQPTMLWFWLWVAWSIGVNGLHQVIDKRPH
jgi:hypothetical protein